MSVCNTHNILLLMFRHKGRDLGKGIFERDV